MGSARAAGDDTTPRKGGRGDRSSVGRLAIANPAKGEKPRERGAGPQEDGLPAGAEDAVAAAGQEALAHRLIIFCAASEYRSPCTLTCDAGAPATDAGMSTTADGCSDVPASEVRGADGEAAAPSPDTGAAAAIGALGPRDAEPALLTLVTSAAPTSLICAAGALANLGSTAAVPCLAALALEPRPHAVFMPPRPGGHGSSRDLAPLEAGDDPGSGPMTVDRHQVEAFLYLEARRMDENAYDDWLALWADEALYWVPANRDDIDPTREVSIVYADRPRLEDRIARLKSGAAYAQDPPSRLRRCFTSPLW